MSKKIIISFILLFTCFISYSQVVLPNYPPTPKNNNYSQIGWSRADSGFIWGGSRDTSFVPLNNTHSVIYWENAGVDSSFWYYGRKWIKLIDANKLNNYYTKSQSDSKYVHYTDTLAMLSSYLRKVDTLSLSNRINAKIDSSNTITINGVTKKLNTSPNFTISTSDTLSLSNRINAKVDTFYNGQRAFTGSVLTGQNPNTTSVKGLLDYVFYPSQPPLTTISGGTNLELMASGADLSYSLPYSMTVQSSTQIPVSILITSSNSQSYNLGSFTSSISGTQSVTVPRNTTTTFYNTATASDGKNSQAQTTFRFYPKFYYGFVSSTSPADADIINMNGVLATSKSQSGTVLAPSIAQYPCFAYPTSFGAINSITINTFLQPSANYNIITRTFTNASGYSQSYYIIVFTTTTNGGFTFTTN